jgi:UDP-N-acetylglucosamine 4,6-dehydratase/5-epimerase
MFGGGTVLITGGTGSFGNAVLERLLGTEAAEIRIFSRDEKKQDDMRHKYRSDKLKFYIGDVRDYDAVSMAMRGVDYVFSAAALKQVPSCEFYPLEAVKTNVLGTANTIEAAIQHGAKSVVVLSTDKAVYPINAMGMSKAIMEKVVVAKSRNVDPALTRLCATRYGNVMASRGSVIPLFIQQIRSRRPITVTNPEMTRFMMTLSQAIDLVIFAFSNANQGDIFVKKAPAATIGDLAAVLQEIFGDRSEVRVIGTRHGEKLFETLLAREEAAKAEDLGDYYRVPADTRDLNYGLYFDQGDRRIDKISEYTSHTTRRLARNELKEMLLNLDYVRDALRGTEGADAP